MEVMEGEGPNELVGDEELMVSFVKGSDEAFDELVGRYAGKITNFIGRQVSDFATAEEIAQDTFLAVYRKRDTFKPGHSFSAWLYAIAINFCRMHFRKIRRAAPMVPMDARSQDGRVALGDRLVDGRASPFEDLSRRDAEQKLRQAIQALPAKQRLVFTLSFYQGMSYEEIGRVLGCSPGTVASRKHTAVKRLASTLRRLAPELSGAKNGEERRTGPASC